MNAALQQFSEQLRALAGTAVNARPLLCAGNPLTCTVALIGANPATKTPFWPFWNDDSGMDRQAWIKAYLATEGKFRRSRAAIERLLPQVKARVIELNAFAAQSKRLNELANSKRTNEVVTFVLNQIKPPVIVCAGKTALAAVQSLPLCWEPVLIEAPHFIYWGHEQTTQLAHRINQQSAAQ
ncbi:hypothetical protein [Hydrogenophaga defluvii]|uniref:Uracil DNA glycosylase superfamily protein n=1 Tax=Hydrogenophaga defluvii TaxID=249410 RepID=A0ABW2SED5_9BURK